MPEFASRYVGRVQLCYIDPPFNTGQTFADYDDALEHSVWLTMLRDRLAQIRPLCKRARAHPRPGCCNLLSDARHRGFVTDALFPEDKPDSATERADGNDENDDEALVIKNADLSDVQAKGATTRPSKKSNGGE